MKREARRDDFFRGASYHLDDCVLRVIWKGMTKVVKASRANTKVAGLMGV